MPAIGNANLPTLVPPNLCSVSVNSLFDHFPEHDLLLHNPVASSWQVLFWRMRYRFFAGVCMSVRGVHCGDRGVGVGLVDWVIVCVREVRGGSGMQ